MSDIRILDCTLRDGGYVNNWEFGREAINGVKHNLERVGVDVIELGFLRNETYCLDRAIYNSREQLVRIISEKKKDIIYSALIEMANYFPTELLKEKSKDGLDAIRYSFWKRKIDEAYEYCKIIANKGYKLCVQPTRVEQYSDEEFAEMIEKFSDLNPYAIYIVDTFGLLRKKDLIRYAKIADKHLKADIILGYHAHNNMQQAFSNATAFIELEMKRNIILDASVYGMGRGAGNLNLEMIANYLNEYKGANYKLMPIYEIWDKYLRKIHTKLYWGYSLEYFIAASKECNPNYATYYAAKNDLCVKDICKIVNGIQGSDKYLYSDEKAEYYYKKIFKKSSYMK